VAAPGGSVGAVKQLLTRSKLFSESDAGTIIAKEPADRCPVQRVTIEAHNIWLELPACPNKRAHSGCRRSGPYVRVRANEYGAAEHIERDYRGAEEGVHAALRLGSAV